MAEVIFLVILQEFSKSSLEISKGTIIPKPPSRTGKESRIGSSSEQARPSVKAGRSLRQITFFKRLEQLSDVRNCPHEIYIYL